MHYAIYLPQSHIPSTLLQTLDCGMREQRRMWKSHPFYALSLVHEESRGHVCSFVVQQAKICNSSALGTRTPVVERIRAQHILKNNSYCIGM